MIKRKSKRTAVTLAALLGLLISYKIVFSSSGDISPIIINISDDPIAQSIVHESKNGIFFYDINQSIELTWRFECIKTQMRYTLNTHICIHDPKFDKHVSKQLVTNGLWEPNIVRSFIKQMQEVNDAQFIDIGANIGLYTLIAAKYNRSVIAIEPLHENIIRLHKAAHLESVQSKITVLVNAVSNERKQVKLHVVDDNIGGSFVLDERAPNTELESGYEQFPLTQTTVLVNSIVLDDIVDVIQTKIELMHHNKFIIKIDIEGFEPFAFENCTKLFSALKIVAVFIEFGKTIEKYKMLDNTFVYKMKIQNMLDKLKLLNYEPYEVNGYNKLEYADWRKWPWDIYLRQCDYLTCSGRVYKVQGL